MNNCLECVRFETCDMLAHGRSLDGGCVHFVERAPFIESLTKAAKKFGVLPYDGREPCVKLHPTSNPDNVNHPSHYETGKFECFDVMLEALGPEVVKGFCICNAFKYIYRHRRKNGVEDIKKAIWYLNKVVELEEVEQNG